MKPNRFARVAAPVAFLAAVTIGVLVVRAGLQQGSHHPGATTTTATSSTHTRKAHGAKKHRRSRFYTVQSGDTFDSIARKTGTTVPRIEQLNPGIDPTALHVGQKIRVE